MLDRDVPDIMGHAEDLVCAPRRGAMIDDDVLGVQYPNGVSHKSTFSTQPRTDVADNNVTGAGDEEVVILDRDPPW
jgi:hypothetical protein